MVNRRTIEALLKAGAFDAISDHRACLMKTLDAALASADQQSRAASQVSLFGEDEADAVLTEQYADVKRWTLREQLSNEKLSLGFYLGGHPYQEYAAELGNFIKVKLADLTPSFVGQSNGKSNGGGYGGGQGGGQSRRGVPVLLAGIVSGLRLQQTRRGRMAVITLEDGDAQIELTVFNELIVVIKFIRLTAGRCAACGVRNLGCAQHTLPSEMAIGIAKKVALEKRIEDYNRRTKSVVNNGRGHAIAYWRSCKN